MREVERSRRGALVALAVAILLLAAGAVGLRFWEKRADRQSESLVGIGSVLPGRVTEARRKVGQGQDEKSVLDAVGKPSVSIETHGASRHAIWTYYYADGTMTLNLTDGYVVRADLEYGPPRLATPGRTE